MFCLRVLPLRVHHVEIVHVKCKHVPPARTSQPATTVPNYTWQKQDNDELSSDKLRRYQICSGVKAWVLNGMLPPLFQDLSIKGSLDDTDHWLIALSQLFGKLKTGIDRTCPLIKTQQQSPATVRKTIKENVSIKQYTVFQAQIDHDRVLGKTAGETAMLPEWQEEPHEYQRHQQRRLVHGRCPAAFCSRKERINRWGPLLRSQQQHAIMSFGCSHCKSILLWQHFCSLW